MELLYGWGRDNVFANNVANVRGPGYGFFIDAESIGTVVQCDNAVENAAAGFANVDCSR